MAHKPRPWKAPSLSWGQVAALTWAICLAVLVAQAAIAEQRPLTIFVVASLCILAVWLTLRPGRMGGLVAIICGIVGVTVGTVFGPGHMVWSGGSWRVAAGLLLLTSGVVLLVSGIRRSAAGPARGRRLLAGTSLAFVAAVAIWTLTPAALATNPPHIPSGATRPESVGLAVRDVRYTAGDGTQLGAWYVPSTNGAVVVLRHGAGSTGADVLSHAAVFARHGYGVLITDARGHGRSDGRGMEFGWYGDADIAAALTFLVEQPEVDPALIAVLGLSMGGEEALGAMSGDGRIAAVVAEGATARVSSDKAWLPDIYGWRGSIQVALEHIQYWVTDHLTAASPPISLAESVRLAAPRPVLLITAGNVADEGHAAFYIKSRSAENVTIWNIPDAGHIQGMAVSSALWEETVVGFLDAALK